MKVLHWIICVGLLLVLVFRQGYRAGWEGYKQSHNMQLALDSAYQYGVSDCEQDKAHKRIK